jgi:HTH-type transcriptional regulator/antitoxin HipB
MIYNTISLFTLIWLYVLMTTPALKSIATLIKRAREDKGLSQRALGERVGLPQSHLSKIESGAVDLQTSNLMQIARALDLELTLIPRAALPVVQALSATRPTGKSNLTPIPAYRLDDEDELNVEDHSDG